MVSFRCRETPSSLSTVKARPMMQTSLFKCGPATHDYHACQCCKNLYFVCTSPPAKELTHAPKASPNLRHIKPEAPPSSLTALLLRLVMSARYSISCLRGEDGLNSFSNFRPPLKPDIGQRVGLSSSMWLPGNLLSPKM